MGILKVAVLGLGPSVKLFNPNDFDISIGVNDIFRYFQTDAIVCLDYERSFTSDRLKIIKESTPKKLYSQIANWDYRPNFEYIKILPGYPDKKINLSLDGYWKSFCSPFVAAQVAFKIYHANEIHLFGVDLINHPRLDKTISLKIRDHFQILEQELLKYDVQLIVHGDGLLKK
jgi:hypothetical protein